MREKLRLVSRASRLACIQVEEAKQALQKTLTGKLEFENISLASPGDRDVVTPLYDKAVPDDFFTKDVDEALLDGQADIAIHSAKDLPQQLRDGLCVAALLPSKDIRDVLVFPTNHKGNGSPPKTIGTSSPKRQSEIAELFPESESKAIRGTIQQRLELLDEGEYGAIIVAACALQRLGLDERMGDALSYDPTPQQGRLALVTRIGDEELNAELATIDVRKTAGLVAIVGCAADASLISQRAERYLEHADIILHDRLIPDELLLAYRDKMVSVGKAGGHESITQSEINRKILEEAEKGNLVVRLHGGDPGIFGHLGEELQFLADWNIRYDVVPSLTSAQVVAARAATPLTHRDGRRSVTLVSGHAAATEPISKVDPNSGSLAVYMGVKEKKVICRQLLDDGWPASTGVLIGERLGYKDEALTFTTLGELDSLTIEPPAVYLVGNSAFPVSTTTLFVGTDPDQFLNHGPLIHWPMIRLLPRPLEERRTILKDKLGKVRGIIFGSRYSVSTFMEALLSFQDVRALKDLKILAVGPSTAEELEKVGIRADLTEPSMGGVRSLSKHLGASDAGAYLYPCSDASPINERQAAVKDHGVELIPVPFYMNRTVDYKTLPRLPFQRVLFTSSSTVNAFFENYPEEKESNREWLAVGPSTREALEKHGLKGYIINR